MMSTSADSGGVFTSDRAASLHESLDKQRVPAHVAIIMDGNGRWAAGRRLPRVAGHKAGAKAVREVVVAARALGVRFLTLYSFSTENWSRAAEEVSALMSLFVEVLQREIDELDSAGVRVRVIGDLDGMPSATAGAFRRAMARTADNGNLDLVLALNYGGRREIVDAARRLAADAADGSLDANSIDEDLFSANLYTAGIPDPDLLIRTSGELRVSNFLLWQVAYSEFWVTDVLWPDFSRDDFLEAIVSLQDRNRRFGA